MENYRTTLLRQKRKKLRLFRKLPRSCPVLLAVYKKGLMSTVRYSGILSSMFRDRGEIKSFIPSIRGERVMIALYDFSQKRYTQYTSAEIDTVTEDSPVRIRVTFKSADPCTNALLRNLINRI